ncbi:carboxypeptidase Y-deficient [Malassezia brasiliensis]|uniref:Carboxypeptidase Y-deficient n=1 Tax=Malassezia brasiliensis TaxID=1821822 RepID=A0AAF0IUC3_9BASI|nr:carboxypeptidase Y-deficient [Malassezia brasiliensis]
MGEDADAGEPARTPAHPAPQQLAYVPYQKPRTVSASAAGGARRPATAAPTALRPSVRHVSERAASGPRDAHDRAPPPLRVLRPRGATQAAQAPRSEAHAAGTRPATATAPPTAAASPAPTTPTKPRAAHTAPTTPRTPGTPQGPATPPGPANPAAPIQHHSYASTLALHDADPPALHAPAHTPPPRAASAPSRAPHAGAPYRPGFQPKGVVRTRLPEFAAARAQHRSAVELEEQRMERRLAKLAAIHSPAFAKAPAAPPQPASGLWARGAHVWSLLQAPHDLERTRLAQRRRAAEQAVVKWQDDDEAAQCAICSVPFSLAVRRHHCRLCGRVVCSSPRLPHALTGDAPQPERHEPCSAQLVVEPDTYAVHPLPPRPPPDAPAAEVRHYAQAEDRTIRFCRDCHAVLRRISFPSLSHAPQPLLIHYRALQQLQREINEALPEFHEMLLGLQKKDANTTLASSMQDSRALQADAAQARKELLVRFTRYDQLARKLRALPPTLDGQTSATQERLQLAIYTRATLFLQKNMFPLQSLPNLDARRTEQAPAPAPTGPSASAAHNDALAVLAEQEALLGAYLAEAVKTRNLDDVKTLRANRDEVRAEIARMRAHAM